MKGSLCHEFETGLPAAEVWESMEASLSGNWSLNWFLMYSPRSRSLRETVALEQSCVSSSLPARICRHTLQFLAKGLLGQNL